MEWDPRLSVGISLSSVCLAVRGYLVRTRHNIKAARTDFWFKWPTHILRRLLPFFFKRETTRVIIHVYHFRLKNGALHIAHREDKSFKDTPLLGVYLLFSIRGFQRMLSQWRYIFKSPRWRMSGHLCWPFRCHKVGFLEKLGGNASFEQGAFLQEVAGSAS